LQGLYRDQPNPPGRRDERDRHTGGPRADELREGEAKSLIGLGNKN
jgi:hypothetical protein